jgi:sensor histidine kinase YesM
MLTRNCKNGKKLLVLSFLFTILILILIQPAFTQSEKFRTSVREKPKPTVAQQKSDEMKELNARLNEMQAALERAQKTIAELENYEKRCSKKCMVRESAGMRR